MPALDAKTIEDLTERLKSFLVTSGGYDEITYLDAGGSAAVYRVLRGGSVRAVKAFDPKLFSGPGGAADRRRLAVQRRLIDHACNSLIQTFRAEEAEGTAFIEMEFIEWPQLAKCLESVPDESVVPLIGQLVEAVRYLETLNIVHRDIKPENIHVSPDFRHLKLLDLGVAREFDSPDECDAAVTDDGQRRPFLATAQYSSPEYLFRLDEPTSKLWRGLNLYQVGAVLHDLVKKEALFQHEVSLGNRWLVARAVLAKQPSFSDADLSRMAAAKALALRCLSKDIDTRLALVGWEDFRLEETSDPMAALRGRLSRKRVSQAAQTTKYSTERLLFERGEYLRRIFERVRTEIIEACGTQLPLTMHFPNQTESPEVRLKFSSGAPYVIECIVRIEWKTGLHERAALVFTGARIVESGKPSFSDDIMVKPTLEVSINEGEAESIVAISHEIARLVGIALDKIDAIGEEDLSLDGVTVQ